mmetsp:Transcript_41334/g.99578  ORF Transcript_41334/g.99578 Transcript_41334/m.99578 type:complete len:97 (+) Transcript_41334:1165-1455(+)
MIMAMLVNSNKDECHKTTMELYYVQKASIIWHRNPFRNERVETVHWRFIYTHTKRGKWETERLIVIFGWFGFSNRAAMQQHENYICYDMRNATNDQ